MRLNRVNIRRVELLARPFSFSNGMRLLNKKKPADYFSGLKIPTVRPLIIPERLETRDA